MTKITKTKRAAPQRSNSVKVTALTMLKRGDCPTDVSKLLQIPISTLGDWRRASKAAGTWEIAGPAGDNNNVARLTDSMPQRVAAVIEADGEVTKY